MLANGIVQPVYTEKSLLCQFWRNIGHRPDLISGKSILAIYARWLGVYYDVP